MIMTGTISIIENQIIGYDGTGYPICSPVTVATVDANVQNKPSGELKYAEYGLNEREDNKYVFCQENPIIKASKRVVDNNTGIKYDIMKVLNGYPDGHIEFMMRPVVGEG